MCKLNKLRRDGVMSLAENSRFDKNASIAFDRSNANVLSPNPYNKQKERTNRSVAEMSSLFLLVEWNRGYATMKSSLYSDEIQGVALDEIKSVCYNPAKQDFIAEAISSTVGGFHPSKTDLTAWYSVKSIMLSVGACLQLISFQKQYFSLLLRLLLRPP